MRPRVEETARPFRIWNSREKRNEPCRYYAHSDNAKIGALIDCKYKEVGVVLEVYNCITGRLLAQYKRGLASIQFLKGD